MAEAARRLDGRKSSDKTAAIAATAAVKNGIRGNGNDRVSSRRRKLGVTIAVKRRRRDEGVGARCFGLMAVARSRGVVDRLAIGCHVTS